MAAFGGDFQRQLEETTRENNAQIEFTNQDLIEKHKEYVQNEEGTDKTNEEIQSGITGMGEVQKVSKMSDMYKSVASGEKSIGDLMREEGSIGDLLGKGGGKVVNGMSRISQQVQDARQAARAAQGSLEGLGGDEPIQMDSFAGALDEEGAPPAAETEAVTEVAGADTGAGAASGAESGTADAVNAAEGERAGVAEGAASDVVGGAEDLERGGAAAVEAVGKEGAEVVGGEVAEGLAKTAGKAALGFGGKVLGNVGGAIDVVKDFEAVSKSGNITDFFKGSGGSTTDEVGNAMQVVGGLMDLTGIGAPVGALLSGVGGVVQEIGNANDDAKKEQADKNSPVPQQTFMASANIGAIGGLASAQINPMKMISGGGTF
jgi:hypothetical protein